MVTCKSTCHVRGVRVGRVPAHEATQPLQHSQVEPTRMASKAGLGCVEPTVSEPGTEGRSGFELRANPITSCWSLGDWPRVLVLLRAEAVGLLSSWA